MSVWDSLKKLRLRRSTTLSDLQAADAEILELPTYTRIEVEDVTIDFYLAVRSGDPSFEFMPPGLQTHSIGVGDRSLIFLSTWARLGDGREFFRSRLASNVQRAVVESGQRADFVREEHVLVDQHVGARAGAFTQDNFHSIPPAWIVSTRIDLIHDDVDQLREMWDSIMAGTPVRTHLAGSLALLAAARIDSGLEIASVWTDEAAARGFNDEVSQAIAQMPEPANPTKPRSDVMSASYCMISNEFLAASGIEPQPN